MRTVEEASGVRRNMGIQEPTAGGKDSVILLSGCPLGFGEPRGPGEENEKMESKMPFYIIYILLMPNYL